MTTTNIDPRELLQHTKEMIEKSTKYLRIIYETHEHEDAILEGIRRKLLGQLNANTAVMRRLELYIDSLPPLPTADSNAEVLAEWIKEKQARVVNEALYGLGIAHEIDPLKDLENAFPKD